MTTTSQPSSTLGPAIPPREAPAESTPPAGDTAPNITRVPLIQPDQTAQPAANDATTETSDWTEYKGESNPTLSAESQVPATQPTELFTGTETTPAGPQWVTDLQAKYQDSLLPGMLLAAGVIVLVLIMMRRLARKPKQATSLPTDERLAAVREQAIASITPLERSLAEAEELTRRLAATLDNKADRIDLLIQEADRKLEELNRANAQITRHTPVQTSDRQPRPQRTIDPSLMDRARVEQDRAERAPDDYSRHEPTPQHDQSTSSNGSDPVHHRVWALADDGIPTVEIARSLNQPVGQVELILNLRQSG